MKHNLKITFLLILMFIVTQLIGLAVVNFYLNPENTLPFGLDNKNVSPHSNFLSILPSILFSFVLAIFLVFLLMKYKVTIVLRIWFTLVTILAIALFFNVVFSSFSNSSLIALIISIPLAILKLYHRNFVIHNLTELIIYPGIAAVFVPLFNIITVIIILILIAIYDAWAVWHSGIMQKMAKYQMNQLKVFGGFFVPYIPKKLKEKIKLIKSSKSKNKKIKITLAILGGGDIVFPIIASGVILKFWGIFPALLTTLFATLSLCGLMFFGKKKKFYPAMPFITTGLIIGILLSYIIFVI